jgi:hypothetical protein
MIRKRFFLLLPLALAVVLGARAGPTSIQIRMDCGDLRFKYFGIPARWEPMPEPARSRLLSAVAGSSTVQPVWLPIVPQHTSYDHAGAYQSWYHAMAAWADVDPTVCRLLVEEFGNSVKAANGERHVAPRGLRLLHAEDFPAGDTSWLKDPAIIEFCSERGYVRPEWGRSAAASEPSTSPRPDVRRP